MGLFLGLGLLGAAFGIDAIKQAPYDRAMRKLDYKYPFNKENFERSNKLKNAIEHCRSFENEPKPVVEWRELNRVINLYKQNEISFPYDSAIHDIAEMAAILRGFEYGGGYTFHVVTTGQICDEKNIHELGIFGTKSKFSARRCLMTERILEFEQKNNGKLRTPMQLFEFLEKENCKTQELYNAYAQKFPDSFENDGTCLHYYDALLAALDYEKWKNGENDKTVVRGPKKVTLVTNQAPSNIKLWDDIQSADASQFYHLEYSVQYPNYVYDEHKIYSTKELRDKEVAMLERTLEDMLTYVTYESNSVDSEERLKRQQKESEV